MTSLGFPHVGNSQIVSGATEALTETVQSNTDPKKKLTLKPVPNLSDPPAPPAPTETANPNAVPVGETDDTSEVRDTSPLANPASEVVQEASEQANEAATATGAAAEMATEPIAGEQRAPRPNSPEEADETGSTVTEAAMRSEAGTGQTTGEGDRSAAMTETTTASTNLNIETKSFEEMKREMPAEANVRDGVPPTEGAVETKSETPMVKTETSAEGELSQEATAEPAPPAATTASGEPRPQPTAATASVLEDEPQQDRTVLQAEAAEMESDDDAKAILRSVLGGALAGAVTSKIVTSNRNSNLYERGQRLPSAEVGRTSLEREQSVSYLVNRFAGEALPTDAPYNGYRAVPSQRDLLLYNGNRRVVRYSSRSQIPPVLLASNRLQRVDVAPANQFGYQPGVGTDRILAAVPPAYRNESSYAVSYRVDPDSAVSRGDILFRQGSTAFADTYSYDLVLDFAEAIRSSRLQQSRFVIEGHASAEGEYGNNLRLSQDRAERIARDLVRYGVDPARLVPVGYGEGEATFAASAPESQRSLDRKVVIFRLIE